MSLLITYYFVTLKKGKKKKKIISQVVRAYKYIYIDHVLSV